MNDIDKLIDLIKNNELLINTTSANKLSLIKKIELMKSKGILYDETVWTFLSIIPYTISKKDISYLFNMLTKTLGSFDFDKCWIEALPIPPRINEGNTNLDLAIGDIRSRSLNLDENNVEANGIEYSGNESGSVCFCEMKWYADCSLSVKYHKKRNQIIRIIENLLCFQNDNLHPDNFYFTLVTPEYFRNEGKPYSRFYSYLIKDYIDNKELILKDIEKTKDFLELRSIGKNNWQYPVSMINEFIDKLKINWISFEELISKSPQSEYKDYIVNIYNKYCDIKPHSGYSLN